MSISKQSIKKTIGTYRNMQKDRMEMAEKATDNFAKTYWETIAKTLGDVIEDLESILEDQL